MRPALILARSQAHPQVQNLVLFQVLPPALFPVLHRALFRARFLPTYLALNLAVNLVQPQVRNQVLHLLRHLAPLRRGSQVPNQVRNPVICQVMSQASVHRKCPVIVQVRCLHRRRLAIPALSLVESQVPHQVLSQVAIPARHRANCRRRCPRVYLVWNLQGFLVTYRVNPHLFHLLKVLRSALRPSLRGIFHRQISSENLIAFKRLDWTVTLHRRLQMVCFVASR